MNLTLATPDRNVRRPYNPNRRKLEQIDAGIATRLKGTMKAEGALTSVSSEIVVAGAQMAAIMADDLDEWQDFAGRHSIKCKGANWQYREIATVLWRNYRDQPKAARERISQYGKAIHVAHDYYRTGITKPSELIKKVVLNGGVAGLAKLFKLSQSLKKGDDQKSIYARIKAPSAPALFMVRPDATFKTVPLEIAGPVLTQMEALHE